MLGMDGAADARPQAVGADEGRAGRDVAIDALRLHLFSVLSHRGDGKSGAQRYARLGGCGLRQHRVQVSPMHDPVGSPVAIRDPAPEGQHRQRTSRPAVVYRQGIGHADRGAQRLGQPQPLQHAHAVGSDLDSGTGSAKALALLEHGGAAA